MPATNSPALKTADLVITRLFDAPRALVWKAWTDPEMLMQWHGPKDFTCPVCQIDLRVGGKYLTCMQAPDGQRYYSAGVYREIVPMERLVCTDSFADEQGNVVPATYYGLGEDLPLEFLVTVIFEAQGGKTLMTLTHAGFPVDEHRESAGAGWGQSFDKLAEVLQGAGAMAKAQIIAEPGKQEIRISRIFDAPRALVFKANTDPALIPQWWGHRSSTLIVDKLELRKGGIWRFIERSADGNEYAFTGVFHVIAPPEQVVQTFEFEPLPGRHVALETLTLEDYEGKTKVSVTSVFQSVEDRDGMLQSGMEDGLNESYSRLDELLEKLENS